MGKKVLSATLELKDHVSFSLREVAVNANQTAACLEKAGASADALSDCTANLADSLEDVGETAQYTKEEVESLGEEAEKLGKGLDDIDEQAQRTGEGVEGLEKKTASFKERLREFGDEMDRSVEATAELGDVLVAAGIGVALKEIAEGLYDCVDASNEFSTAFAKITTIADTSEISFSEVRDQIKSLSSETAQSVGALSEATYEAISSGVETADAVSFVATANRLAVGGYTETTTAVDVLTTALNAYGLEVEEAGRVSDVLIVTQNLGKTSVDQLASSVGKVIPLASAYNVEIENLGAAYAVLTANGIDTAEAGTYLKSILSELASESSVVAKTLKEETGSSFTELMGQGQSLGDVLQVIGDSVDGDATAFSNMWASIEAGVGALSLFNSGADQYNAVLGDMEGAAGATKAAYETMTDTAAFAEQKMVNAAANLKIAIGDQLSPVMQGLEETATGALVGLTGMIEACPALTAAGTALVVGLGTLTVATVLYTNKTVIATAATKALAAAKLAVASPIALVVTGVAALAAGIAVYAANADEAVDETEGLTAASKAQYDEIQSLNEEYERTCDIYGETSYEAQALKWEIEDLSTAYDNSKTSVEEFNQRLADSKEAYSSLTAEYSESTSSIDREEQSVTALALKLGELSEKSVKTAEDQAVICAIVDNLNEALPELSLNYNAATQSLNMTADAIIQIAKAEASRKQYEEDYAYLTELVQEQCEAEINLADAKDNLSVAQEREVKAWTELQEVVEKYNETGAGGERLEKLRDQYTEAYEDLQTATTAVKEAQSTYDSYLQSIEETSEKLEEYCARVEEAEEKTYGLTTAAEGIAYAEEYITNITEDVEDLAAAYDAAYESAYSSLSNTVGMFQTMSTEVETSTDKMMQAMQSQMEWINNYSENIRLAAQYGISEGLVAALSDGSQESANYLQAIISQIETLGASQGELSQEAADFVSEFNAAYEGVETAKEEFSNQVADMSTNFSSSMDEITAQMSESIGEMDMSSEAARAAASTMQAYIDGIYDKLPAVQSAFSSLSQYTSTTPTRVGLGSVEFNASGTDYASDIFVAGEEGPELVIGAEGAKVLPNDETMRILSGSGGGTPSTVSYDTNAREKVVTLRLEGGGTIRVRTDGALDKDAVIDLLYDELRPVLIDIIEEEIEEEGVSSYGF